MASILVFGLPISKVFNKNENYNAIFALHQLEKKYAIATYSIGEITPEILWDYNGKIKKINENEMLEFPSENKFGLLVQMEDVERITSLLNQNYQYQLNETYNLNVGSKQKDRLICQFYIVSKK